MTIAAKKLNIIRANVLSSMFYLLSTRLIKAFPVTRDGAVICKIANVFIRAQCVICCSIAFIASLPHEYVNLAS